LAWWNFAAFSSFFYTQAKSCSRAESIPAPPPLMRAVILTLSHLFLGPSRICGYQVRPVLAGSQLGIIAVLGSLKQVAYCCSV
jgi:hypothetical protein